MRPLFVTGTGPGVGCTRVSAALLRALRARGEAVAVMKPVACDGKATRAGLRSADALALLAAAGRESPYEDVNPYCFSSPLPPQLAAREAGVEVDLGRLAGAFRRLRAGCDRLLVEGTGGWSEPLGPALLPADLVRTLELPVLLVVGLRHGCLGQALLAARQILGEGRHLLGWVASALEPDLERPAEHLAALEHWLPVPRVGTLGHGQRELVVERAL